ncbi:TonB-dependent receptor domain-containing protein [Aestuariibaculum lutulentum]|uniref:TonB-dependent receptor n=1 Tax=Aestuariibaculum lutulentum TaxID=2920935 RepID=A0ABS9RLF1_9FLAO|nr:TonB-dependent receptor [Aestuariibaculum lutulentum]MCH4553765.1 TonB-dependent receptor [Aestuariibaculum lutulentum]
MKFTKIICLLFFLIFFSLTVFSQSKISGKVIDQDTNTPLSHVSIILKNTNDTIYSNNLGHFEIYNLGTYTFHKLGYKDKIENILENHPIIQLQINPNELHEVMISSNQIAKTQNTSYTSSQIITTQSIEQNNTIDLAPVLNQVSGVFMQNGALNTNRITIRGIGSRNLYGTSKIRAYFKDIPLTTGNGETTIEDFELSSLARIEIIKGSRSSIYGAGLGGFIKLIPKTAGFNQTNIQNTTTIGSFGLFKDVIELSSSTKKTNINTVFSHTRNDGYRNNSSYNRKTITLNANHYFNERDEISFLGSFVDFKGYIPSSVDEQTYLNTPESAAFTWEQSKGYEDTRRSLLGLSWHHQYSNTISQKTSVFSSFKNAYEPRPFNILSENLSALGFRSRILKESTEFKWTFGIEFFNDFYNWKTFENLYQDTTSGTGSVQGNLLSNFKEKRYYVNAFFETDYSISNKTGVSLGLNFNKTNYKLKDYYNNDSNPDQSGSYTFKSVLSPTLGLTHSISKNSSLYSNISHGFSPPTTTETLLPDGLINTNIKPETGWNFEIGSRSIFFNNRLQCNLSVYRLNVSNLLVAKRTGNDEYIGLNAGKTRHDGFELDSRFQWFKLKNYKLNTIFSYTLNRYKFKDFIDGDNDYSGNDLTGVPGHIFNLGLDFNTPFGIYGNLHFQNVGSIPITDDNTLYTDSYNLTNFKMGWLKNLNKTLNINVFLGINNIFDKAYASQILINAMGFNGSQPRYYYPGNPINYYTGFNITCNIN